MQTCDFSLHAQGCSDAGVCSIGGMKEQSGTTKNFMLALNTQYGIGEKNTAILIPQIEFTARIDSNFQMQIKLPWVFASGNLGKTNGLGDIILTGSYRIRENKFMRLGVNAGFRIAVNDADIRQDNLTTANTTRILPMPYQTSLGTHDLLLGADMKLKNKWLFAIGLQLPLIQNNRNGFDTALLLSGEDEKRQHFSSRHLERKPDLVVRIDRSFRLHPNLILNAGLLPILHLGNDTRLDSTARVEIEGSSGLTLNINTGIQYRVAPRTRITGRYASPLVVRTARPDGLTRHWVAAIELAFEF